MNCENIRDLSRILIRMLPAFVGLFLFGCPGPTRAGEPNNRAPGEESPNWSLSKADSGSLGSPYKMSSFEIRPPASFRFKGFLPSPGTYCWDGPIRADQTGPKLFVQIVSVDESPAPDADGSLAEPLRKIMDAIKKRHTDWSQTPAEEGRINGLPFIRSSWSGSLTNAGRAGSSGTKMHGIVYLTIQENREIRISCQDVAPDHDEGLRLGGFAALTFRSAPAENAPR
jgi:hypothetical protein